MSDNVHWLRQVAPATEDEPETSEETERLDQALIDLVGGEAMLRVRSHEIERGDRGTPMNEVFAELDADS